MAFFQYTVGFPYPQGSHLGIQSNKNSIFRLHLGIHMCAGPTSVTRGLSPAQRVGTPGPHVVHGSAVFTEHLLLAMIVEATGDEGKNPLGGV